MNKDQKLLEEAYCKIYESIKEPLYFGPKNQKDLWFRWLEEHNYEVNGDGSVDINESVRLKKRQSNNNKQVRLFISNKSASF